MTAEMVELSSDTLRFAATTEGGGIDRLEAVQHDGRLVPVLMPATGALKGGCQLLVPWSNRLSGGGFDYEGQFHAVAPNVAGERYPLHGDGFQRSWRVSRKEATELELELEDGAIGPYRYTAHVTYGIGDGFLFASLTVVNQAAMALPFGLGFHPWFPRTPTTLLRASATQVELQDEQYLPTEVVGVGERHGFDFRRGSHLPGGWVNNAFLGWDGTAELAIGYEEPKISLTASTSLNTFILYSPSTEADFFCFEPVTHAVDAHQRGGLTRLEPGEAMSASMVLRVSW
ncbi:MAG TPA: aldose 1-epimerase [Devosia sp.]|uniref:aldose 1-epimerase n=1 Tax=Devosia sp. TaxID=1871048 RepID=UPI002DDCADA0|nr:aldose 1-epimerase [Devosia sp.]HEV2514249.1 aldose 1-epimerase [Devosia sp.]